MIEVLLHAMRHEAPGIVSLELAASDLPRFSPGSHIDLILPNGLSRSYSLLPPRPESASMYRVAVLNVAGGRGGSACVHEQLRVGQTLRISGPRQNFPCDLNAENSVLLAGGIGITPLYAMAKALVVAGRSVELIYCARSRPGAAFLAEIEALPRLQLTCWFDDERGGPPRVGTLLSGRDPETRFYACGPVPMLAAFEAAVAALGLRHALIERFTAPVVAASVLETGSFNVVLHRSGRTISVAPGQSILKTLLAAGVNCDYSCTEGLCGACETRVLGGTPDHRDFVLTEAERASNQKMMICVSRCKGDELILDL